MSNINHNLEGQRQHQMQIDFTPNDEMEPDMQSQTLQRNNEDRRESNMINQSVDMSNSQPPSEQFMGVSQPNPREGYMHVQASPQQQHMVRQHPPPSRGTTRAQAAKMKQQQALLQSNSPYAQVPQHAQSGSNPSSKQSKRSAQQHQDDNSTQESGHKGPKVVLAGGGRQQKFIQQQHHKDIQNWPFYQMEQNQGKQSVSNKDGRREKRQANTGNFMSNSRGFGTAPDGMQRGGNARINLTKNPYGIISGKDDQANGQNVSSKNSDKSNGGQGSGNQMVTSSRQTGSGGGNGSNSVQNNSHMQNQMIAKIYGRSNKFVMNGNNGGANSNLNDQYKKPKIQHMKDLIRQGKSQKQSAEPSHKHGSMTNGPPTNDNSSNGGSKQQFKRSKGESAKASNGQQQIIESRQSKMDEQSFTGADDSIERRNKPGKQWVRDGSQSSKKFDESRNEIDKLRSSYDMNSSMISGQDKNGGEKIDPRTESRLQIRHSRLDKVNVENRNSTYSKSGSGSVNSISGRNGNQGLRQGQGLQGDTGTQNSSQQKFKNSKNNRVIRQTNISSNFDQPTGLDKTELGNNEQKEVRRSNMNLNEILHGSGARGRQGDMTFDSALADEDERKVEIIDNLEELAAEGQTDGMENVLDNKISRSFQTQKSAAMHLEGQKPSEKGLKGTENGDFEAVDAFGNPIGMIFQQQSAEGADPIERHVLFAANNNVQFSSGISQSQNSMLDGMNSQQQSNKRSRKANHQNQQKGFGGLEGTQGGENSDLDTLGKFFCNTNDSGANNLDTTQVQFSENRPKQSYGEMKRLQTSQGPRLVKYKNTQANQQQQQLAQAAPPAAAQQPDHKDPNNREAEGQAASGPPASQNMPAPPQTAPSSQMQKIQFGQKNQKVAKIKGKLSSQFQVIIHEGEAGSNTIQPQALQTDPNSKRLSNMNQNSQDDRDHADNGGDSGPGNLMMKGGAGDNATPSQKQQFSRTIDASKNSAEDQNQSMGAGTGKRGQHQGATKNQGNSHRFFPLSPTGEAAGPKDGLKNGQTQLQPVSLARERGALSGSVIQGDQTAANSSNPVSATPGVGPGPLGYQFEQWQRPPSRQKEPNQALGLDDPRDARPKTRGGGGNSLGNTMAISTHHNTQYYGQQNGFNSGLASHTHMSGRDRKRNIQQFIPQSKNGVLSVSNMYQVMPQSDMPTSVHGNHNGRNNISNIGVGNRPRMIDFFDKRNNQNNNNGFNSTGDQSQYFQTQYQQQKNQQQFFQNTFEDLTEFQQNMEPMPPTQNPNPRRGGTMGTTQVISHGLSQQRPPSRHKDPPQNLGLDLYPPGMGFAQPGEFGFGGATPHTQHHQGSFCPSIGGGIIGLDVESDIDVNAGGIDSDGGATGMDNFDIDLDNAGYFWGNGRTAVATQKQFKEDEDGFFENQYGLQSHKQKEQLNDSSDHNGDSKDKPTAKAEKLSSKPKPKGIRFQKQYSEAGHGASNGNPRGASNPVKRGYHPRGGTGSYGGHGGHQSVGGGFYPPNQSFNQNGQQFAQTYGHGMSMGGPMVPGTAPNSGQYSYHPALQQTQNIYIGMNQIMPQNNQLANELFNMSTNMSNLVQNQPKSHHASRRPAHTAGGPGSNAAFHSSGIENQQDAPDSYSNANQQFNNLSNISHNQEFMQRGFANQRSPVNDRSGALQYLVMQNPHLKNITKPKSATGHRISGKQNRFKNLNNSGRFVGQNSTIIHSAYNNSNVQQLKMYQKPKAGGWMEQNSATNNSGQKQFSANTAAAAKISKSQINKAMIKPATAAGTSGVGSRGAVKGQIFINDSNNESNVHPTIKPNQQPMSSDNVKEMIKIGQEINHNRPKESKGQRSTEKRHINNQSLGVTGTGGGIHAIPITTTHLIRANVNVQSPLAGGSGSGEMQNLIGMRGQNSKGKQNMTELFSQTSKFSRGDFRGAVGTEGLQQNSIAAFTDKLVSGEHSTTQGKSAEHAPGEAAEPINNQTSFKSQTLQFPKSEINTQLGDEFINLFAN